MQTQPTKFDNIASGMLADMIGEADYAAKSSAEYLDSLKAEAKRRGIESERGERFQIDITQGSTRRLDTKGLEALLGDALEPYYKTTPTSTLRIKAVFTPAAVD